jgi:hypothetical protein
MNAIADPPIRCVGDGCDLALESLAVVRLALAIAYVRSSSAISGVTPRASPAPAAATPVATPAAIPSSHAGATRSSPQ